MGTNNNLTSLTIHTIFNHSQPAITTAFKKQPTVTNKFIIPYYIIQFASTNGEIYTAPEYIGS